MTDADEAILGTDPLDDDSDDDGLTDGAEVDLATEPLDEDTDGDGFLDGDEVDSRGDPLDPLVGVYAGGWPYNPDKDQLPVGAWNVPAQVGVSLPRFAWPDQYGNAVDIYDYAMHGAPVVIEVATMWAPPSIALNAWIAGDSPDFYGLYDDHIPNLVADGTVLWVTIVVEDLGGLPPDQADVAAYAATFTGPNHTAVLADARGEYAPWVGLIAYPNLLLLDEDLTVAVMTDAGGDYAPILDALLARFP